MKVHRRTSASSLWQESDSTTGRVRENGHTSGSSCARDDPGFLPAELGVERWGDVFPLEHPAQHLGGLSGGERRFH